MSDVLAALDPALRAAPLAPHPLPVPLLLLPLPALWAAEGERPLLCPICNNGDGMWLRDARQWYDHARAYKHFKY